jgi:hypothetical protein
MMETNPVSKNLCLKKVQDMDTIQNKSQIYVKYCKYRSSDILEVISFVAFICNI